MGAESSSSLTAVNVYPALARSLHDQPFPGPAARVGPRLRSA